MISVVTVVFNGEDTLESTIQSVIAQDYSHIEYLVIDGGSTDGTLDIIRKYEESIEYWISEPDKGIFDAMNKGIRASNGKIICMLNADDYYQDSTVLSRVAAAFQEDPERQIVYTDLIAVENGHRTVNKPVSPLTPYAFLYTPVYHPASFVKRQVYDQVGLYDTTFEISADWKFFFDSYRQGIRFYYLPGITVIFSEEGASRINRYRAYRELLKEQVKSDQINSLVALLYFCWRTIKGFWINRVS